MTAQHTPGPWKVLETKVDGMHQTIKVGPGFTGDWEKCIIETPSGSQTLMAIGKANANLIAAAPELLEVLEKANNFLTIQFEHYQRCLRNAPPHEECLYKNQYDNYKAMVDVITPAIAKATGKVADQARGGQS